MTTAAMIAVLFGALLHAGWNAMIRRSDAQATDVVLVVCGAALIALAVIPLLPLPAPASWPHLLASGLIHVAYFLLVAASYRHGELSLAYPVMRGTAPLLSAVGATLLLSERLTITGWLAVMTICGGILLIAADAWKRNAFSIRAGTYAIGTACTIVVYTLVDGAGARLSGDAAAYTAWVFVLTALPLTTIFLARDRHGFVHRCRQHWRTGFAGGACTLGAYALALWAMTQAPVALVAALRETSVVFGALIAAFLLKERVTPLRWTATAIVASGAAAIRFA